MGGQLLYIEEIHTTKSKRVRFTDMNNMETQALSSDDNKSLEDVSMLDEDEGDELDYSITTEKMAATSHEQDDDEELRSKPPLSCDNCNKKDEVTEEPLLRVNSTDNLETLNISLEACEEACSKNDMHTPLITPPSSPQQIRTLSIDGATTEEATICEWPCNLTVDNAITSAVEQHPSFPSSFFTD